MVAFFVKRSKESTDFFFLLSLEKRVLDLVINFLLGASVFRFSEESSLRMEIQVAWK